MYPSDAAAAKRVANGRNCPESNAVETSVPVRKTLKIAISALLLGWVAAAPAAECNLGWICVRPTDHDDGGAHFTAENLRDYPVTVSVRLRGRNLKVAGPNPVTVTVPGKIAPTLHH